MSIFVADSRSFPFEGDMALDSLFDPILSRFLTASLHLVLMVAVLISWLRNKSTSEDSQSQKHIAHAGNLKTTYYKTTHCSCLSLSFFNLTLCLLSLFYSRSNGWSDEKIVTLLDLGVKTVSWFALNLFLHSLFSNSRETKLPLALRIWWGVFFVVSCFCLVTDVVCFKRHKLLSTAFWASDIVSVAMSLLLCCIEFWGKKKHDENTTNLEEHLLNGSDVKRDETVSPFAKAGFFSLLTFSWIDPLISLGHNKTLNLDDVPHLAISESVKGAFPTLEDKLEAYCDGSNTVTTLMLAKGLISTAWREFMLSAVYVLINILASYVGPYLIDSFVQYLNGRGCFKKEGYVLVSSFSIAKLVECVAQRHWYFKTEQAGFKIKAALIAKLYNKGLTLSCQSKQGHTTGEVINFMSVDAERIDDFTYSIHDPWTIILQVVLALMILYRDLGLASVAALVAAISMMLANIPLGRLEKRYQEGLMKSKDKRMKLTAEVLRNMRILKLHDWEMKFLSKIQELRSVEAGWLQRYLYTSAAAAFVFWGAPAFVSMVTFGSCMLLGIPIESGKMLSALATFKVLQEPIYQLPGTISMFVQTKVSLDRIASFLSLEDLKLDIVERLPAGASATAVEVIDGSFSWDASSSPIPTLNGINFRVSSGMRVAVCGTVGSGKSSLLSCVLGEMPKVSGVVRVWGTKAYVAQSAWIQSGKIEENILFGKKWTGSGTIGWWKHVV